MKNINLQKKTLKCESILESFLIREKEELRVINEPIQMDQQMLSREREIFESNIINYSEFHKELDNMDRGHDNR